MSKAEQRVYNTFVKGLITEASPLSYPPNSSYDEDNCILYQKGNRTRRLGIDYESGASPLTLTGYDITKLNSNAVSGFVWHSPGGNSNLDYYVLQVGTNLYFFDLNTSPISYLSSIGDVDISGYAVVSDAAAAASKLQFTVGNGILYCAGSGFEPFYVTLTNPGVSVSTTRIYIQIRDFDGLSDSAGAESEPSTLTAAHHYNLDNQGWATATVYSGSGVTVNTFDSYTGQPTTKNIIDPFIATYYTGCSKYPPNNKVWYMAIDSKGTGFNVDQLRKLQVGSGLAAKGYFILNAFNKDYTAASGIAGLTAVTTTNRPRAIGFFAGRVWYAVGSSVYFSQVVTRPEMSGMCYQANDPTAQDINQLVASDGGVVTIPDMTNCIRLFAIGSGLMLLADNGVWFITGTAAGFSATDFTVVKISPIGCDAPDSIVDIDGEIYWFSKVGIQAMSKKTGFFSFAMTNIEKSIISNNTIQSFYNQLTDLSRQTAKASYDPANNVIQWLIKSDTVATNIFYDRVLNYALNTKSFYPWTVSSTSSTPNIVDIFPTPQPQRISGQTDRYTTYFKYLTIVPGINYGYLFSQFSDTTFADWRTFEGSTGYTYDSFLETGYELLGNPSADGSTMIPALMQKKQIPFLMAYMMRTEQNYVGSSGQYTVDKPSYCQMTTKWDWSSSTTSNKWSTPVNLYRVTRLVPPDDTNTALDNGYATVVTKNKIRGNGRAIQFRFHCNYIGYDFNILGWAVIYAENMFA